MSKKNKKQKDVQIHKLKLTPLFKNCYFSDTITCSFCSEDKHNHHCSDCINYPTFNLDRNYISPAFILSQQRKQIPANLPKWQCSHEKKVKDYTQKKSDIEILQPKPKSKSNFCNVCKQSYQDYRQHIQQNRHRKNLKTSKFNNYIEEIAKNFKNILSSKDIQQTPSNIGQQECESNITKKIKIQSESTLQVCTFPVKQQIIQSNLPISSTIQCKIPVSQIYWKYNQLQNLRHQNVQ